MGISENSLGKIVFIFNGGILDINDTRLIKDVFLNLCIITVIENNIVIGGKN